MMPTSIESSIRDMCSDAISQAVSVLAEKYGFDPEEAARTLADSEVKIVRKRGPAAKSEPKVKLGKGKPKSEDKPKRAKTGYLIFADFVRENVRSDMEAALVAGEKLKPQDVVREIAAKWKTVAPEEKEEWSAAAKEGKAVPDFMAGKRDTALRVVADERMESEGGNQDFQEAGKKLDKLLGALEEDEDSDEESDEDSEEED